MSVFKTFIGLNFHKNVDMICYVRELKANSILYEYPITLESLIRTRLVCFCLMVTHNTSIICKWMF